MFLTGLLLVLLFAGLGFVLAALHFQLYLVMAIPAVLLFFQYWSSDKIALFGMHAHIVTPEEEPELHGVIDRLCALSDIPKPRVAVAETDIPNAFATGRNPRVAVVCATRGITRRLDEPELEAVLAHEISHVVHRDVAIMTVASVLGV
jgi:heat shock protein HtpX